MKNDNYQNSLRIFSVVRFINAALSQGMSFFFLHTFLFTLTQELPCFSCSFCSTNGVKRHTHISVCKTTPQYLTNIKVSASPVCKQTVTDSVWETGAGHAGFHFLVTICFDSGTCEIHSIYIPIWTCLTAESEMQIERVRFIQDVTVVRIRQSWKSDRLTRGYFCDLINKWMMLLKIPLMHLHLRTVELQLAIIFIAV